MIRGDTALLGWREKHTLPVPGHEYSPQFRRKQWDGMWAPGKWCRQNGDFYEMRCSRGLVRRVVQDLGGSVHFNAATFEEISEYKWNELRESKLRDYQERALLHALSAGWGRIAYATNAGKGAVIAKLALFCQRRGQRVLICCDEVAVFDALCAEIQNWAGIEYGTIRAGIKVPPQCLVNIAMVPTLARRVKDERRSKAKHRIWADWLAGVSMLLLDEADKADADSWKSVLGGCKNSLWRVGFSGSFPTDLFSDLKFDELMGPIIERVENAELIDRGVSAKPLIEVHRFEDKLAWGKPPTGWWDMEGAEQRRIVYDRCIVTHQERHYFIKSLIQPDTATAIVVNRIEHGEQLQDAIPGSVFLDGSCSEDYRIETLDAFAAGNVDVIIVTKILDRGTNRLGHTADLIFASGEGSPAQVLQRIGRGLRRAGGKEYLRLVDVADRITVPESGPSSSKAAAGFLKNAVRKRLEVYASQGFEIEIHG